MKIYIEKYETNVPKLTDELTGLAVDEKIVAIKGSDDGVYFHLSEPLTAAEQVELESTVFNHNPQPAAHYRIMDLINDEFKGLHIENIDFARHLKADLALQKKISKLPNGRPEKSEYYYNNELIARINFVFDVTSENLVTRRREVLNYVKTDDTLSGDILIKDKIYDLADIVDGEIVINERVQARVSIVSSMKAVVSGILAQALQQNLDQVVLTIRPFWDEYKGDRDNFIELGDYAWRDKLLTVDVSTTPHTWLAIEIQPGVTIRDYIVGRISY